MKFDRASGILLHPSSLPGRFGIGDLGPQACRWVDFLADAGCKLWQVLPLGPTGYGDSPYQCFSAFAGNPYLISPELLMRDGLISEDDLAGMPDFRAGHVDYGTLIPWKLALLEKAFARFESHPMPALRNRFDLFCTQAADWLDDFALFMATKEAFGGGAWNGWPGALRRREMEALMHARLDFSPAVNRIKFIQFLFFDQWMELKKYVNGRGIRIIGDIPIFVAYDSADAWSHPDLFHLDEESLPTVVAGVPPDYFSPTGQLWGNPLYKWEIHKKTGYAWWLERIRATLKSVDLVRIDHFRGFAGYWEVPYGSPTAEGGRWVPGPGADFFEVLRNSLGDLPILAEDLGEITPDVIALRDQFNLPGMKILQFAFSGPDNPFLPHKYPVNCAAYSGTHDNDTALGWYAAAPDHEKDFARRYLHVDGHDFAWDLIRAVWGSVAALAVAPMQDLLSLDTRARMNFPSRLGGNWEWRMVDDNLNDDLKGRIRELNWLYER
jgi:4-alpha-glucanotransferase